MNTQRIDGPGVMDYVPAHDDSQSVMRWVYCKEGPYIGQWTFEDPDECRTRAIYRCAYGTPGAEIREFRITPTGRIYRSPADQTKQADCDGAKPENP